MANTYLTRTQTAGNNQKFTYSCWFKVGDLNASDTSPRLLHTELSSVLYMRLNLRLSDSCKLDWYFASGGTDYYLRTNRSFRDTSAWYHLVIAADSTQGSGSDRMKMYINGVQETSFAQSIYPPQNLDMAVNNNGTPMTISKSALSDGYFTGLMSYVAFVDGTAELPTIFGETDSVTGQWKIKTDITPSVAWGTNGFLILKNGNSLTDESTNTNNFTLGGGTLTKTEDNPSNVFATLNSLTKTGNDIKTVGNGNTSVTASSSSGWGSLYSTLGASTGKFYCEVKITDTYGPDANNFIFGIQDVTTFNQISNEKVAQNSTGFAYRGNGNKTTNNVQTAYGDTYTTGNIIGVAMDLDNSKLYFSKDGVWQNSGDPTSGATGTGSAFDLVSGTTYVFGMASYYTQDDYQFNFGNGYFGTTAVASAGTNASGNGIFEYDTPTGYTALSTKGLNL